jgi:hypothetical protein
MGRGCNPNLRDYEALRNAFPNIWWSASQQTLFKCSLFQGMYSLHSNLSSSGHATMASSLNDVEVIEAIRYNVHTGVQRAMSNNQLHTTEKPLYLLRRVEVMEASEGFQKPHSQPQTHNRNASRPCSNPGMSHIRSQTQNQARQIQY